MKSPVYASSLCLTSIFKQVLSYLVCVLAVINILEIISRLQRSTITLLNITFCLKYKVETFKIYNTIYIN